MSEHEHAGVHHPVKSIEQEFQKVKDMGIHTCQLNCWNRSMLNSKVADTVLASSKNVGIDITSFWCGWDGPAVWNFYEGPLTLGLVPEAYRNDRLKMLLMGSDFAKMIGVENLITHVGFVPEDPNDVKYKGLVSTIRYLASYCKRNGQHFLFETGQETPVVLLRLFEDVELDNLGVNLDPANLILYGKANPVDALDVIGKYVRGVHAKDALYPTTGKYLGLEVPIGEGKVNFPELIKKLKSMGYDGPITIEREISGEQQIKDILNAKALLEKLI
ncbi:MAG: sugar phosphate isomerase/epimerase [Clostridia bacterium]|nr:sugar phosphate isomerase/epimerase [Clostridia bacterium]